MKTPGLYTKELLKANKSLEAYSTFTCGHMKEILYHSVAEQCPYCILKTQVISSQHFCNKRHEYLDTVCAHA